MCLVLAERKPPAGGRPARCKHYGQEIILLDKYMSMAASVDLDRQDIGS